jgi:general secretion pathway protein J
MALFSLLLLAALAGPRQVWARTDRDFDGAAGVAAARDLLGDRLQRIWPVTDDNVVPTPGPDFDGQETQLTFLAPPPDAEGVAPLRRYRLSLAPGGDLVLESRSERAIDRRSWPDRKVLLRGVQAIDLAYFGPSRGAPAWAPQWQDQPFMPQLVRLRLGFAPGDRRRWPDLVVHPLADIDTDCHLMVQTGGCVAR